MALSDRTIWLDGALVPFHDVQVHLLSQSLQRGTLVFDVMSVHDIDGIPRVFGLTPHLRRFLASAESMGMECPYDLQTLCSACASALSANPNADVLKISAYFDEIGVGLIPESLTPRVAVSAFAIEEFGGQLGRDRPATVQVAARPKMPGSVIPLSTKVAAAYTPGAAETIMARRNGADVVLFLDDQGFVREGASSSFFAVVDSVLYTAPLGSVLAGITRASVIDIARDQGLSVVERNYSLDHLLDADEAFLTSTTVQVWPVDRIDSKQFSDPPGAVTTMLSAGLQQLLSGGYPRLSNTWLEIPR